MRKLNAFIEEIFEGEISIDTIDKGNWMKGTGYGINSEIGDIVARMSYRFLRSSIAGDGDST